MKRRAQLSSDVCRLLTWLALCLITVASDAAALRPVPHGGARTETVVAYRAAARSETLSDWRSSERCGVDIEQLNREMHVRSARGTVHVGLTALAVIACRVPVLMPVAPVLMLLGHTAFGARLYRRIADQRSAIPVGNRSCATEGCALPTVRPSAPS